MQGIELAVAPVAEVQGLLVLDRELRPIAEGHARRRAGPDVDDRRQAIDRISGPLAGAVAIAELGPAGDMQHARGPIPGRIDVPLHVRVIREQLAVAIEGEVERVAIAHRDELPVLPVRAHAADVAAGSLLARHEAASIDHPRQEVVFSPDLGHKRAGDLGQVRGVAGDDIEGPAIRRQDHAVRAVLAPAVELAQQLDLVQLVVIIGVQYAVEPAVVLPSPVDDHVEAIEGPEQSVSFADGDVDRLDHDRFRLSPNRRRRDAVQLAILVRDDQSAFGVDGHVDPGTLSIPGHRVEQLDPEPFRGLDPRRRVGGCLRVGRPCRLPGPGRPLALLRSCLRGSPAGVPGLLRRLRLLRRLGRRPGEIPSQKECPR